MRRLLLDTHIWLWYAIGSQDLPTSLKDAIDDATGRSWLSPISIWELGMLQRKGKIRLQERAPDWTVQALEKFPLKEASINFEVAREVSELQLPHSDPADHLLAATARIFDLTLVTLDRHLQTSKQVETLTA